MNLREAQQSLANFVAQLVTDTPADMVQLGSVLADFQREFFDAIAPALQQLIGRDVQATCKRFYEEATRGHSKFWPMRAGPSSQNGKAGKLNHMPRFTVKDLLIATTLIAVGVSALLADRYAGIPDLLHPSPAKKAAVTIAHLISGPLIGAGFYWPFKRPWTGAIVGFVLQWALLFATMPVVN